jgi:POT family proton-dependent oligopeptide transporter
LVAVFTTFFWAAYGQTFNTVAMWALTDADRTISFFGWAWEVPATWFQSLNPLLIIIMAPLLNVWWAARARQAKEPDAITKIQIGCWLLGAGFLLLAVGDTMGRTQSGWIWLLAFSIPQTLGELYLSPTGQSLFNRAAPVGYASFVMGLWFLNHTVGNYFSGLLGAQWAQWPHALFFTATAGVSFCGGIGLWIASNRLRASMLRNIPDRSS